MNRYRWHRGANPREVEYHDQWTIPSRRVGLVARGRTLGGPGLLWRAWHRGESCGFTTQKAAKRWVENRCDPLEPVTARIVSHETRPPLVIEAQSAGEGR